MAVVAKLEILSVANTGKLASGFAKGKMSIEGFAKSLFGIHLGANLASDAIGKVLSAAHRFASWMLDGVGASLEQIDAMSKLSTALGFSTRAYAGLAHGANLSGMASDQFATTMEKMNKVIGEALGGSEEAGEAFSDLGLSVESLAKMRGEERLFAIADAIQKLGWNARTAAALAKIFGKSAGPEMLQFLGDGRAGLEEYIATAERLGVTFDELSGAKIEAANDAWTNLTAAFRGAANVIAMEVAPAMQWLSDMITDVIADTGILGQSIRITFSVIETVLVGLGRNMADIAQGVVTMFNVMEYNVALAIEGIAKALNWLGAISDDTFKTIQIYVEELGNVLEKNLTTSWANEFEKSINDARKKIEDSAAATVEKRKKLQGLEFDTAVDRKSKKGSGTLMRPGFAERGSVDAAKAILDAQARMRSGSDPQLQVANQQLQVMRNQDKKLGAILGAVNRAPVVAGADL